MLRLLIGLVSGIILTLLVPVVLIAAGLIDMGAANGPGFLEQTFGHWAFERWAETHAPEEVQTAAPTTEVWEDGLALYEGSCVHCHGAPNVDPAPWARHMVPEPPDLALTNDEQSDGEVYLVIHQGVRMTGMPAFGEHLSEQEIWKLVRFVSDIEHLTPDQKERLREATRHEHAHAATAPGNADEASHDGEGHHGDGTAPAHDDAAPHLPGDEAPEATPPADEAPGDEAPVEEPATGT